MKGYLDALVNYALDRALIQEGDELWAYNRLLEVMGLDEAEGEPVEAELPEILTALTDDAVRRGLIEDNITARDLFDTKLMGAILPPPHEVRAIFEGLRVDYPEAATDWYYQFSCDSNYIRRDRIQKDLKWVYPCEYGELDITVNLSKPEKDPRAIAAAKLAPQSGYPKCQLCAENEGYAGRMNHPARQNHRIIPLTINDAPWYFQYSPYVYYNEHCIVFNAKHTPMKIDKAAFLKLFDFVSQFPHYFVGSNADLPIVGGSILSHDHFQGGHYEFAMAKAPVETPLSFAGFEDVQAGIVKWPMSVIRLTGSDRFRLAELADKILLAWRGYTDEAAVILAETDGVPHNTITPIVRRRGEDYQIDLVLRNNLTTEEFPLGLYHPHQNLHHIKKENIGLIEVMGLAETPNAGDSFDAVSDERLARELVEQRKQKEKEDKFNAQHKVTLDNLFSSLKEGEMKELNIVVKADVQGSVEAVTQNLEKLSNDEVRVRVIHGGVGAINDSDVMLAGVSNAIIVGFNVRPDATAQANAERDGVDMRMYRVIYDCIEEIESAMKGMLAPKTREVILGTAEVRNVIRIKSIGNIAGCYVKSGKIQRGAGVRVVRDGIIIADDNVASLQRFKDSVKEVAEGYECGIGLEKYNDIKEGDIFEVFTIEEYRED